MGRFVFASNAERFRGRGWGVRSKEEPRWTEPPSGGNSGGKALSSTRPSRGSPI